MKKLVIDHNQVLQVDDMTAGTSDTSRAITRPCPKRPAPSVRMLSAPIRVPRVCCRSVFDGKRLGVPDAATPEKASGQLRLSASPRQNCSSGSLGVKSNCYALPSDVCASSNLHRCAQAGGPLVSLQQTCRAEELYSRMCTHVFSCGRNSYALRLDETGPVGISLLSRF